MTFVDLCDLRAVSQSCVVFKPTTSGRRFQYLGWFLYLSVIPHFCLAQIQTKPGCRGPLKGAGGSHRKLGGELKKELGGELDRELGGELGGNLKGT